MIPFALQSIHTLTIPHLIVAMVEKDRQCHELVLEILLLIVHSSPLLCVSLDGK